MGQTGFLEAYGLRVPIVSAGMAMVAGPALVAAVSEAGGLGLLGTGPMPPDLLRAEIRDVRARTGRAFGVSLIVEETALGPCTTDAHVAVCALERVSPVVFFWNPPKRAWMKVLREAGSRIWINVHGVDAARAACALAPDALIVQGGEAGGHVKSTEPLRPLLAAVHGCAPDLPLVAAGGIGDAAGARAALEAGADAVCVGTALLASDECLAHPEYKARLVAAGADDTTVTRVFGPEWPDVPMRVLRNRAATRAPGAPQPRRPIGTTRLFGRPYEMPPNSAVLPTRETRGDLDEMCLAAGTSVAFVGRTRPAARILRSLAGE